MDDLPVIRQLVSEQLTTAGMRCDAAEGGVQALKMLREAQKAGDPYKMAIIDYLMPEMNGEMLASAINDYPELKETCLIMLTAAGSPVGDDEFVRKGFSAYIAKPVENRVFIRSLAVIWDRYRSGETDTLIHVDTSLSGHNDDKENEPKVPGARVLVAEDNLVNQVFVKEILEEMKCKVTLVANGQESLDTLKEKPFDLVIMDCLMPVMDGFEATRQICQLKQRGVLSLSLPVVALTANAMKEDEEKCLAAGMDEYIAKPIRKALLKRRVFFWLTGETFNSDNSDFQNDGKLLEMPQPKVEPGNNVMDTLDREEIKRARSILKDKYDDMVHVFITNSWERIEEMSMALDKEDIEEVIRPSHSLKSSGRQMGAPKLSEKAKEIEAIAKAIVKGSEEEGHSIQTIIALLEESKQVLSETKVAFDLLANE